MKESAIYALVTGASSGIGWHISKELAARGYSIVAVSNQAGQLEDLKSELDRDYQVGVITLECDLSDPGAPERIYDICQQKGFNVEVLVNNAGMFVYGEVTGADPRQTSQILQLHMHTPVMLCRLFGALMERNQKGHILNVSSISAVMPFPTISLYGPSKTFLRKFTRALRYELKGSGIHVTCLIPGATATDLYNTDNINLSLIIRLGIMKKPELVAKVGVQALFRNRKESVPGLLNRFILCIVPLVPPWFLAFIYKRVKKRKQ